MAPKIFGVLKILCLCVLIFLGIQNLNFMGTQICGYSKFVGAQNLFILKICRTEICGYSEKLWVLFFCIHTQKIIDTQNLGHYHLWVLKICGY